MRDVLIDFVVGAAEVFGAVIDDALDKVGLVLDGEDDGDFAIRFGAVVGFDVGELARSDEGAHVFLDGFRTVKGARPRLDLRHDLLGRDQPVALDEDVGHDDAAGLGEAGDAAQENAQHDAGAAQRRRKVAIRRSHGLVPVVSEKIRLSLKGGRGIADKAPSVKPRLTVHWEGCRRLMEPQ